MPCQEAWLWRSCWHRRCLKAVVLCGNVSYEGLVISLWGVCWKCWGVWMIDQSQHICQFFFLFCGAASARLPHRFRTLGSHVWPTWTIYSCRRYHEQTGPCFSLLFLYLVFHPPLLCFGGNRVAKKWTISISCVCAMCLCFYIFSTLA